MTVHRCIASCFPRRLTQLVQALLPSDQRVSWQPFAYCFLIPKKEDASAQLQVTDPDRDRALGRRKPRHFNGSG